MSLNIERGEIVAFLGEHGAGKSLVAIARALAVDCDFLVLDEPTASLPADEVERLFQALRPLKAQGVGMIYVSHRLDEIFRIAWRCCATVRWLVCATSTTPRQKSLAK